MSWPLLSLERIAVIVGGSTPRRERSEYWGGTIPWVTPSDLPAPGRGIAEITETGEHITTEGLESCSAHLLPEGSVLFSSRATIGKIGIARVPVATNQGFANFIPKPGIDSKFLAYALLYYSSAISEMAGKTTFKEVSKGALRPFRIPVPPLSEQRRIVEILDQADALRKRRAVSDRKSEQILPVLFIKMFGDPNLNAMRWPVRSLAELAAELRYGTSAKCVETPGGLPVLRIPNVVRGEIDLSDLKYCELSNDEVELLRLEQGDLLIVRTNGNRDYVGRCAVFTEERPCLFASYLIRVRLNRDIVDPWYVSAFLRTSAGRYAMSPAIRTTAGQSNINTQGLRQVNLPVPPIERQEVFRDRVFDVQGLLKHQRQARERVEAIFSSLLAKAFSGELTAKWREAQLGKLLTEMKPQQGELGKQPAVRKRA